MKAARITSIMHSLRRRARPAGAATFIALLSVMLLLGGHALAAVTTGSVLATGLTAPNGLVNIKGQRWVADHILGFCRVDAVIGINPATCFSFNGGGAAGQASYDAVHNYVFVPDGSAKSQGVWRLRPNATGTAFTAADVLIPSAKLGLNRPNTAIYNPADNAVYISFLKNGSIVKVTNSSNSVSLQRKVNIGSSSDGRRIVSMAVYRTATTSALFIAENSSVAKISNVNKCAGACIARPVVALSGVVAPAALAYDGLKWLYVANLEGQLMRYQPATGLVDTVTVNGEAPTFVFGLGFDKSRNLYVMTDPDEGVNELGIGSIYKLAVMP